MRLIKFRARHAERLDGWCYGSSEPKEGELTLSQFFELADRGGLILPFDQFNGLTDKNGKEIWEGDVVAFDVSEGRAHEPPANNQRGIVTYQGGAWTYGPWCGVWCYNVQVIGNIYENPELVNT